MSTTARHDVLVAEVRPVCPHRSLPREAQVEAQVERAWEKVGRESHGDWSEVRDQVSFGYTYRTPGAPNPS